MRNVLVVMSRLDSEKLASVQFSKSLGLSLGVVYSMPECVPDDCRGLSLCRLSFTKQPNTKPLYSFLEETFIPDLIIIFDCYEKRILDRLYGVGCPVVKIISSADAYCLYGDYRYPFQFFRDFSLILKEMALVLSAADSKRSYFHQRDMIQCWKQSSMIVITAKDDRVKLLDHGVSDDIIQLRSGSLIETVTMIVTAFGL